MKIMFICGAGLVGGKERQTLEYMIELKKRGHDVFCVTSSWGPVDFENLLSSHGIPFEKLRIGYISMKFTWSEIRMTLHQGIYLPYLFVSYRRLLRKWDPCVVVHTNFHHILVLLPFLRSPRQVFHVHDVFPVNGKFARLFRMFNRRMDLFVGVSEHICRNIAGLGVPGSKIKLVYNGVRAPSDVNRVAGPIPVVGIVGQIGAWKGHDVLIDAMASLKDIPWKLYVIGFGDASYIDALKDKIAKVGLNERVVFTGKRAGMTDIYRDVDIVCVPSLWEEPFGLVAVEPGFFGIPVVSSDRGGLPEIVVNNETGLVVPSGDIIKLSSALRDLLIDPERRRKLGGAGAERVRQMFSIEASGLKMEETLRQICEK